MDINLENTGLLEINDSTTSTAEGCDLIPHFISEINNSDQESSYANWDLGIPVFKKSL